MYEKKIILHEGANFKSSLFYDYIGQLGDISSILIAVGPEGGFTDEEVELAVKSGFDVVSLGERRLRSETASIIGLGIFMQFLISKKSNK